jgi:hypothetical protein
MTTKLLLPFITYLFNSNAQVLTGLLMLIVLSISNKENKPMLLILQMLIPAKALSNFNTLDFAIWARDNVVAVKLDLTDDEPMDL